METTPAVLKAFLGNSYQDSREKKLNQLEKHLRDAEDNEEKLLDETGLLKSTMQPLRKQVKDPACVLDQDWELKSNMRPLRRQFENLGSTFD